VRIDYDTPPRSSTSRIAVTPVKNGMCTANPCRHRLVKIVRYGLGSRDG
jgi:hypothetical protein